MPRSPPAGVSAAAYGGFPLDGGPPDRGDPALVNLVTTGCQLDGAAFAATILHLGARRVLALSEPEPGRLWCTPTREGAGDLDLTAYERLVLDDVTSQFAEAGGAPFARIAPRSMRLLDLAMAGPEGEILPGQPQWGEAAGTGPGPWETRPRVGLAAAADDPSAPDPVRPLG